MTPPTPTLGTLLRHLIELLDGAVEQTYRASGLDYRPRYTPVVKALMALGPVSIRVISRQAGISHSAASQTVSQMAKAELVFLSPGEDGRERIVALTPRAQAMLPAVTRQWRAVNAAAAGLDAELSAPLSALLVETIAALERQAFGDRIAQAAGRLSDDPQSPLEAP
ncbi:transcriptional regulator [Caulobacter sp. AP07]|uniref:MarR family winged helix-turn-helix transcriptional regulator n=1 Tax=Caulobacter sp. AP07 TaxID=1144304 RepID=UPI000271E401|nr:MarR family winged helix-turn-helix transcriptional regulator [Caulobacter sp. AP07]EJL28452.1 transcriptional regulator [Caulobacter sp. AP07]